MEVLQNKQDKNAILSIRIPREMLNNIDEIKWRDRKSRTRVIVEFLQNGIAEKLNNSLSTNQTEVQ